MKRVFAIAALAAVPLLSTQPVLAQDCFCGAPVVDADAEQAPETPDTTIESSATPDEQALAAPAAPTRAPSPLWCSGGNDPRCMPMQPSDAPAFQALASGPVAAAIDLAATPLVRVAEPRDVMTPAEGLAPARGVQRSLDRPPRA